MRHKRSGTAVLAAILGTLVACGQDPTGPAIPYTFSVASGGDQVGSAGWPLDSLAVRLVDRRGDAVDDMQVVWLVTSGEGLFQVLPNRQVALVSSVVTQTGTHGEGGAAVRFIPTEVGTNTVTAYATSANGGTIGSVEFTSQAENLSIQLDRETDWNAAWPEGPQDAVIELGTSVEWRLIESYCCGSNRVRSIAVPSGGTSFDEEFPADSTIVFEPDAPGTWTWAWVFESTDPFWFGVTVSDTATIVVQ